MLQDGSGEVARLLAGVRMHDGPIGPGTLFAAVAPLERLAIVEPTWGRWTAGVSSDPARAGATGSVVAIRAQ